MSIMVKITYDTNKFALSVKGHAETAVKGQDILCSAVSILTYTLAQNLISNANCLVTEPQINLNDGSAVIICVPKDEYAAEIKQIFDVIMTGFYLLEKSYKKNIKILGGRVREYENPLL